MPLIDESYFTGPLAIGQITQPAVKNKLLSFIARYEPIIMAAALGYDFYDAFKTGVAAGPIATRWQNLLTGVTFSNVQNVRVRWAGFQPSDKVSPLAGFVYYEYMRDLAVQNTGIGLVKNKGENSEKVNVAQRPVDIFNDAVLQLHLLWELLDKDQTVETKVYPEFDPATAFGFTSPIQWGKRYVNRGEYDFSIKNTFGI